MCQRVRTYTAIGITRLVMVVARRAQTDVAIQVIVVVQEKGSVVRFVLMQLLDCFDSADLAKTEGESIQPYSQGRRGDFMLVVFALFMACISG